MIRTETSLFWIWVDRFLTTTAWATILVGWYVAYIIVCPSDKLRHDAAHAERLPSFSKITLRAK